MRSDPRFVGEARRQFRRRLRVDVAKFGHGGFQSSLFSTLGQRKWITSSASPHYLPGLGGAVEPAAQIRRSPARTSPRRPSSSFSLATLRSRAPGS